MKPIIGILLITVNVACLAQGKMTFEGPPALAPGTGIYVQQYYEAGMWFRPLGVVGPGNGFDRMSSGRSTRPENGGAYLAGALGDSLQFSFTNGSSFNMVSVDLAEYSTVVPNAVTVPFIGYRQDGSTVSTSFTTDGIIDGIGPLADFQTFYFGPEFSNLTRVEVPSWGWSLDNLVVSIPEPGTGIIALAGLGVWWLARKRSRGRETS